LDASGKASFTTSTLTVGGHNYSISYSGDGNDDGSSTGNLSLTIGRGSTVINVSASKNMVVIGRSLTFTATVAAAAPASGTPTGSVTFFAGNTNLGSVALQNGAASVTANMPTAGSVAITVTYRGDTNFKPGSPAAPLFITVETLNQAFVSQAYLDLLHRPVDSGGLQHWSALLDAGTSRSSVAFAIEGSLEYRQDVVDALYVQFLHRHADPGGLSGFANALGSGSTIEAVEATLIGSAEYYANRGGSTINGFLSALYLDVLNRPIDPTGQAAFGLLLSQGLTPRSAVAGQIINSGEGLSDRVKGWYTTFLHRPADSGGLAGFVNALQHGITDQQAIAFIVGSDEYFAKL
jgi:hypothetical protein